MREILNDIRGFSGVLDSVAGSMTDLSHNILEYVKPRAPELCSYSQISGDQKPRRSHDPDFSTADRTAGARAIRGHRCCTVLEASADRPVSQVDTGVSRLLAAVRGTGALGFPQIALTLPDSMRDHWEVSRKACEVNYRTLRRHFFNRSVRMTRSSMSSW